jgi:hypothetical protein
MMAWAREEFRWDRVIDHHEELAGCAPPRLMRREHGRPATVERF